jgi:hypothetical protein
LQRSWTLTERAFGQSGQRDQEIGQLCVTMLGHEPLDVVAPAPSTHMIASVGPRTSDRISEPSRPEKAKDWPALAGLQQLQSPFTFAVLGRRRDAPRPKITKN